MKGGKKKDMKTKKLTLCFLVLGIMLVSLGMVSAIHTSNVAISPSGWLKPNTATTFTFSVSNMGGTDIVYVKIAKPTTSFGDISCGTAPTNWALILSDTTYCKYAADSSSYYITAGNSKTFTVQATPSVNYGDKSWTITTTDMGDYPLAKSVTSTIQTIQNAIDTWDGSSVINVPAGAYTEDLIIPANKTNLEIIGASKETTIIRGQTTGLNTAFPNAGTIGNSIAALEIQADGVHVHGFTIETPELADDKYAHLVLLDGSNIEMNDNIFNMKSDGGAIVDAVNDLGPVAIQTWTAANGGTDIKGLNIHDNTFKEDDTKKLRKNGYYGIYLNLPADSDASSNRISIKDNTFSGKIWRAITTEHSYVDIEGNTITTTNNDAWNYGKAINVFQWAANTIQNVSISDNSISGSLSSDAFLWGVTIGTGGTDSFANINVSSNTLSDSDIAFNIYDDADKILFNNNVLSNNVKVVVNNDGVATLDARYNNWGTVVYSEILALKTGNVNVENWLPADTTDPVITFIGAPYLTNGEIAINATITDDRGLTSYTITFGDDGDVSDSFSGVHNTSANISEIHTYNESGDYTVTITATDESGNVQTETTVVKMLSLSDYDWVIQLQTGWNLISIPYDLDDTSINSVLSGIISDVVYVDASTYTILQYDATTGTWKKARPYVDRSGYTGTLTTIKPGYAYWIKMQNDAVLYGKKKTFAQEALPLPSVNLKTGSWNLIGRYGVGTDNVLTPTNAFVYDLTGNFYEPVLKYDNGWVSATHINTYKGYWLRTKANTQSTIAYEPGAYYFD